MSKVPNQMSFTSRTGVGVGNLGNIYRPKPIPAVLAELPVYLNDELEALSGRLNNFLQGGVFPPVSELPKRYKEGTCLLFKDKVVDAEGTVLIPSAGLYIYFGEVWNSIPLTPVTLFNTEVSK